jgi:hypothetical protein
MPTLAAQLLVPEAKTDLAGMSRFLHCTQADEQSSPPSSSQVLDTNGS